MLNGNIFNELTAICFHHHHHQRQFRHRRHQHHRCQPPPFMDAVITHSVWVFIISHIFFLQDFKIKIKKKIIYIFLYCLFCISVFFFGVICFATKFLHLSCCSVWVTGCKFCCLAGWKVWLVGWLVDLFEAYFTFVFINASMT